MKPSELLTLLSATIERRISTLITGAPGVGKTDIVSQAARLAANHLIVSFPSVEDPTEPGGYPWIAADHSHAHKVLFGQAHKAVTSTEPTVWFLDDLGQATPATQAAYMQWLLAREINGHRLPDHVTIIAATNRRTDRAGVSGILEPVKSRFGTIVQLDADLDEWCRWAIDHTIDPRVVAFIRFRPDLLSAFAPTADLTNSPSPRTWANASRMVALELPSAVQYVALAGSVGEGAAVELAAFFKTWQSLACVDQILLDPTDVDVPSDPATLYALAGALAHKANETTFGRIAQYLQKMVDAGRGEFGALLLRDALQRAPAITNTTAFVKLATTELGSLITGKVS